MATTAISMSLSASAVPRAWDPNRYASMTGCFRQTVARRAQKAVRDEDGGIGATVPRAPRRATLTTNCCIRLSLSNDCPRSLSAMLRGADTLPAHLRPAPRLPLMTRSSLFTTALAVLTTLPILPADEPPKREAKTLGEHTGTVRVLYAPDGTLATFSDDRTIQLRDAQGRVTHRLVGHESLVIAASFTPDSKTLATADGKAIRLWDTAKSEARTAENLPAGAERLA